MKIDCKSWTLYGTCIIYSTGWPVRPHARFRSYSTGHAAGAELVRDWLRSLDERDRNAIGLDLMRVQFRWPVGMPLCRAMGDGLWEVRTSLPSNRIARVLFCVVRDRIVILHGFIKKTQKTPDEELTLARKRKKEFEA